MIALSLLGEPFREGHTRLHVTDSSAFTGTLRRVTGRALRVSRSCSATSISQAKWSQTRSTSLQVVRPGVIGSWRRPWNNPKPRCPFDVPAPTCWHRGTLRSQAKVAKAATRSCGMSTRSFSRARRRKELHPPKNPPISMMSRSRGASSVGSGPISGLEPTLDARSEPREAAKGSCVSGGAAQECDLGKARIPDTSCGCRGLVKVSGCDWLVAELPVHVRDEQGLERHHDEGPDTAGENGDESGDGDDHNSDDCRPLVGRHHPPGFAE